MTGESSAAVNSIVTLMLDINSENYAGAWHASTGRYNPSSGAFNAFQTGYQTSRYYQATFGTPVSLASDLIAVPVRFVSHQNGAAEGDPSIPACTYWPQYVYLVANRGDGWLPDTVGYYTGRGEVAALKREGASGPALNPIAQETAC